MGTLQPTHRQKFLKLIFLRRHNFSFDNFAKKNLNKRIKWVKMDTHLRKIRKNLELSSYNYKS